MRIRHPIIFILGVALVCFTPAPNTATDVDFSHRNKAWVSHHHQTDKYHTFTGYNCAFCLLQGPVTCASNQYPPSLEYILFS